MATLFKRLLRLGRERVVGVELEEDEGGIERVVVTVALRPRRVSRCSGCARRSRSIYDSRPGSWRHLDMGRVRCLIRAEVRRVACPSCGVRTEAVPWARAGSRFTRAFEDTCVYLVKHAPKSTVAALMRIDWATVGRMIERVVTEHQASQPGDGMDGLSRIGIDEVAYRKGHRYLMCVSDHGSGALVWASPGRSQATAEAFYAALGPERCRQLRAVSLDLHGGWITATRTHAPQALICADPFHVIKLAGDALDRVRREAWQALREEDPDRAAWIKGTRFAVRRRAENLRPGDRTILDALERDNHDIYRGWLLVEQLRAVYQAVTHQDAMLLLDDWILAALTSDLDPFIRCALTIDTHRNLVVNAITERLSNARLEGMNSTVRLLSHRARGYRRLSSLLAMITLVCGRIPTPLPT
ncbi:MAG: ISL3 family transposase [Thermoleophilia bacterium]|nr:ISL3 family transposase [Thermoleophilia bacterium]